MDEYVARLLGDVEVDGGRASHGEFINVHCQVDGVVWGGNETRLYLREGVTTGR